MRKTEGEVGSVGTEEDPGAQNCRGLTGTIKSWQRQGSILARVSQGVQGLAGERAMRCLPPHLEARLPAFQLWEGKFCCLIPGLWRFVREGRRPWAL